MVQAIPPSSLTRSHLPLDKGGFGSYVTYYIYSWMELGKRLLLVWGRKQAATKESI